MDSRTRKKLRSLKYRGRHQHLRAEFAPSVAAGLMRCARGDGCLFAEEVDGVWLGGVIEPGTKWDLGHDDRFPQYHSGPEHATCNRSAPHRNVTSREW